MFKLSLQAMTKLPESSIAIAGENWFEVLELSFTLKLEPEGVPEESYF